MANDKISSILVSVPRFPYLGQQRSKWCRIFIIDPELGQLKQCYNGTQTFKGKIMEKDIPTVEAQMLIRKPVSTVFKAFLDPNITTHFWFTKSSGPLEVGKTVTWEWEMYGVTTNVLVKDIVQNKKIATEWGDPATTVDYGFTPLSDNTTYVTIRNYGFRETGKELIPVIMDNTGGFTTVLDGLKAYLEHNIDLNLIGDKFPHGLS